MSQLMLLAARRGFSLDEQAYFAEMVIETFGICIEMN
jgi:hypothetical protein